MKYNKSPAHLKNLKVTPHDSFLNSNTKRTHRQPQATATTSTSNTNDSLLYSKSSARSRLESLAQVITQKELEETESNDREKEEEEEDDDDDKSSCNQFSNNNVKNSYNTSVATNKLFATMTNEVSSTRWPSLLSLSTSSWSWGGLRPSTAAAACVTLLILTTTCSLCSASLCESQSWWNAYKDKCIPCTVCQGDKIPLMPCQMHRDTVCGSIYDLKIDWVVLSKTEPNWKERRKFDGIDYGLDHHQLTAEQLQQLQDEVDPMDWQTAALFLAVLACLLFFIVAACILVHHMRQWRRMERRLDQDVEELSTKLMAKLAEVQSLEGGTFFIGNADALRIPTSATMSTATTFHQPQHVMLPEKSDKHHHHQQQHNHHHHHHPQNLQNDRRLFSNTTTLKSGNVYIEENSSKC